MNSKKDTVFKIILSESAENDLFEIYYYVAMNDSFGRADKLKNKLLSMCARLEKFPFRGHTLYEDKYGRLLEIVYGNYRIIYEVQDKNVVVLFIIDCRRDIEEIIKSRLEI